MREKKATNKKLLMSILIPSACVLGIAVGGVSGYFISNAVYAKKYEQEYSDITETIESLEDDHTLLMKKYTSSTSKNYDSIFKPYELVNIAYEKVGLHEHVMQTTFGLVDAMGVKQNIRGSSIKNGENYFLENISASSIVQAAVRVYQTGDSAVRYDASKIDVKVPDKATWNKQPKETLTLKEHEEKWGKELSRPLIYIISSKTTLDTSKTEKTSSGYEVSLDLDPTYAVLRYVKQMKALSGVSSPKFDYIHIKFYLDEDLNLIKNEVNEKYDVIMIIKATSKATLTEYFRYDEKIAIPDIDSNVTYVEGD